MYNPPQRFIANGIDAILRLNGQDFTGRGLFFDITTPFVVGEFSLSYDTLDDAIGTQYQFKVLRSGIQFQLREKPDPIDLLNLGIENLSLGFLGFEPIPDIESNVAGTSGGAAYTGGSYIGGYLNTLMSGQANDLSTTAGTANASRIVDAAINQVNTLRAFLGSIAADTVESNIRALEVSIENLSASESTIRDLDYATGVSEFVREQILMQAGVTVLAQANMLPQNVLTLLQI